MSSLTKQARRSASNLILLCHAHHVVVDSDMGRYTATVLLRMKRVHELERAGHSFEVSGAVVGQATREIEEYWRWLDTLNAAHRRSGVPAVRLDLNRDPAQLIRSMRQVLGLLRSASEELASAAAALPDEVRAALVACGTSTKKWERVPYYENSVANWKWELLNLGLPNFVQLLGINLLQLEILLLERSLGGSSERRLQRLRRELASVASTAVHFD